MKIKHVLKSRMGLFLILLQVLFLGFFVGTPLVLHLADKLEAKLHRTPTPLVQFYGISSLHLDAFKANLVYTKSDAGICYAVIGIITKSGPILFLPQSPVTKQGYDLGEFREISGNFGVWNL